MNSSTYWTPKPPLIAILRGIHPAETLAHVGALVAAGFDAIEIALHSPDGQTGIGLAVEHFGECAWIGGGTVLTTAELGLWRNSAPRGRTERPSGGDPPCHRQISGGGTRHCDAERSFRRAQCRCAGAVR